MQRLTACLRFLRNEIPIFGHYLHEFEDKIPIDVDILWCVNTLPTRKEVLKWYLELNEGSVPHTEEEIERVKALLEKEENHTNGEKS
ncbi:hypothetical protein [Neobacillus paridis]|uniref:hypothetical protein n=1 Tax=Neobacillus paridis TaxID=2803862 RepID=UPI001F2217E4|nr:hypothetical protein [Neobacillus paridis]